MRPRELNSIKGDSFTHNLERVIFFYCEGWSNGYGIKDDKFG